MSVVSNERLHAVYCTIAGTSKAGGPDTLPEPYKAGAGMRSETEYSYANPDPPPGWNRVRTGPGNRPEYLFPGQWQTDNDLAFDMEITNATGVYGNEGGAHMNFKDFCNVNGSLDANTNAYRSNANGLEHQFWGTNPKSHPYITHRQINPNGFTEAYNPVETSAVRVANSTAQKWSDALFQSW